MGNGNAYFLDALTRQTDARFTAVRHEAGAVVAADAFHRASGRLAAATTTYGAGFTNTLTALAEAVQAHVPLVLVVGDEPTSGPRPWDVDQIAMASAVGARTYTVGRADAAATTVIAVEHALTYRVPTVLAIPYDVATLDTGPVPETPDTAPARAARRARGSSPTASSGRSRPRSPPHAGRCCWPDAAPGWPARARPLGALADATGALTATTALGRGIFPRAEFDLGVAGGFGAQDAMALVREADVAVVVGASPQPVHDAVRRALRARVPGLPGRRRARGDAPARGRVRPGRRRGRRGGDPRGARRRRRPAGGGSPSTSRPHDGTSPGTGSPPTGGSTRARRPPASPSCCPRTGWSSPTAGTSSAGRTCTGRSPRPDRMVMVGTAFQAIGLGFPSVVGAALARPEATVVLTTGDGGGLMALSDLESAVRVAGGRGHRGRLERRRVQRGDAPLRRAGGWPTSRCSSPTSTSPALATRARRAGRRRPVGARTSSALTAWRARPGDERPFLLLDLRISGDRGRTLLGGDRPGSG